jgi:hypothetical protein
MEASVMENIENKPQKTYIDLIVECSAKNDKKLDNERNIWTKCLGRGQVELWIRLI